MILSAVCRVGCNNSRYNGVYITISLKNMVKAHQSLALSFWVRPCSKQLGVSNCWAPFLTSLNFFHGYVSPKLSRLERGGVHVIQPLQSSKRPFVFFSLANHRPRIPVISFQVKRWADCSYGERNNPVSAGRRSYEWINQTKVRRHHHRNSSQSAMLHDFSLNHVVHQSESENRRERERER